MPKATIEDVAQLAGVSIKTVSRVINNEPNVRDTTRERVKNAVANLNYRPNQSARNLAGDRSHLVALVYDDPGAYEIPSSGYIINMQQGALSACKSTNYDLLIHPCNYRDRQVVEELKALVEHNRPDGIILAAPLSNMPKLVQAITDTGTPLVRISPGKPGGPRGIVATNDREASAQMTQYLASLGHRKIAFIPGHRSHLAVTNRLLGYQDGLQASGIRYSEHLVIAGDNSIKSGELCATRLLNRKHRPTAIFCANDDMAAGVIRVADRMDIDVPAQLSVAGFDDIPLARQIYPALTTIRQPLNAMARRAAEMLIEGRKQGLSSACDEIVEATLQVRDSTGPVPASDGRATL